LQEILKKILESDKLAISKGISIVENEDARKLEFLKELFKYTGRAHRIGITGPPGAGKSSITNCLVKLLVEKGFSAGVIAVDPTSPFTGGALLGDRIRMQEIGILESVFIRSMATRGSLGGLCKNVVEACDVLDASGKDFILIETVGVGQSELDITNTADTVLVVLVPESGDAIQAMKAGLMEIANIFVLNKSDRQGADGVAATIKNIIHLKPPAEDKWTIDVLKTIGSLNKGINELLDEILSHKAHLEKTGYLEKKRKGNLQNKIYELVNNRLQVEFWDDKKKKSLSDNLNDIYHRVSDPYSFVNKLIS
jgi:LAO/AO transport system kinase